jgi:hypothetical protein
MQPLKNKVPNPTPDDGFELEIAGSLESLKTEQKMDLLALRLARMFAIKFLEENGEFLAAARIANG